KKVYVIDALDLELRPPSSSGEPWKLWFEGTPNRTDFPLRPVSRIRGEAEFGPLDFASGIHAETGTPLRLDLTAENALLGDLLKVFTGDDYGMHGEINLRFHLTGTTSLLRLTGEAGVEDLHRWDLLPSAIASTLRAQIAGILDVEGESLQLTSIAVPLAEGTVVIRGEIGSLFHDPQPGWSAQFHRVPLAAIMDLVKQFTPDLDTQLLAEGLVDGRLHMEDSARNWVGSLSLTETVLEEKRSGQIARLADFQAVFEGKTGRTDPITITASLERGGDLEAAVRWDLENWASTIELRGEALPVVSFLQWARAFGSRWGEADLTGGDLAFEIGVATAAGKPPQLTGWAELSGTELKSMAVNQPVQVSSARLEFQPGELRVGPFVAMLGGMELTGNFLAKPAVTGKNNRLEVEFDFLVAGKVAGELAGEASGQVSGIDLAELDRLLNPRHRPGTFFGFGRGSNRSSPFFDGLAARGTLHAGWVGLGGTGIENFEAAVDFRDRLLTIEHFRGEFAGGTQSGSATIRFDSDSPAFHLESRYAKLDLEQLTEASAGWGGFFSGKLNGNLNLESSGENLNEILDRLEGSGEVAGSDLAVHGLDLTGAPTMNDPEPVTEIASLSASFQIGGREVLLEQLRAVTGDGTVRVRESAPELPALIVTGSVGFDRTLDLNVGRESGGHQYHWAGTLAEPRLTETAALLLGSNN
ncbi:MAG: AsmA-like C-terminal region-containing protein, partial [Acidobacteriota bacterium]